MTKTYMPYIGAGVALLLAIGAGNVWGSSSAQSVAATEQTEMMKEHKKKLQQTATDAFLLGACDGNLTGCDRKVEVTESTRSMGYTPKTIYYVTLGRVYKGDPALVTKPEEVLLPKACTGVATDYDDRDDSTQCSVIKPEPASNDTAINPISR